MNYFREIQLHRNGILDSAIKDDICQYTYLTSLVSSHMSLKINWLEASTPSFVVLKSPSS
jgi:hypothetical protein